MNNKYKKGRKIKSLKSLLNRMEKRLPVYFLHKFMSYGFIQNWSYRQLERAVYSGELRTAEQEKEK